MFLTGSNVHWKNFVLLCSFLILCQGGQLIAQDGPHRVYMYLDYFQSNEEQYLICETKYRPDRTFLQLSDAEIEFTLISDTATILLGKVSTDENGIARLDLKESELIRDTSGLAQFQATFPGAEAYQKTSRKIESKRINLEMDGILQDSIRTLVVSGVEIKGDEKIAITDKEVKVFVRRTFSNLPIGEGSIEDGIFEMAFPDDVPGDFDGNLTLIAQIIEDDEYGTAEVQKDIQWGLPLEQVEEEEPRALWSRAAPLWIIIAVTLAFAAAWYHYFLSVSKLFKMKKLSE